MKLKQKLNELSQSYDSKVKFINSISNNSKYSDLRELIILNTSFLMNGSSLSERIYCILNDISSQMLCKNCNQNVYFNRGKYPSFCSGRCVGIFNREKIGESNRINYLIKGDKIKEKRKVTNLLKFGVDNPMKNNDIKVKSKITLLEKTGFEFPLQSELSLRKFKETCLVKFGFENPSKNETIKRKKEETFIKNFNVKTYLVTEDSRNALKKSFLKKSNCGIYSKMSQNIFWEIYKRLPKNLKDKTYFGELNREFVISSGGRTYFYDFVISNVKYCIEFNGDYWHANPEMFSESQVPMKFLGLTACEIWKKDKIKIESLVNLGYKVKIIWQKDINNINYDDIISDILESNN
jgi:hypothetical protein